MGGVHCGTMEWNSLKIWPKNERKVLMSRVRAKNADRNNTALLRLFQVVSTGIRHQLPIKIPCYCVAEAFLWPMESMCVHSVSLRLSQCQQDRWLWGLIAGLLLWVFSIVIQLKRSVTLRFSILAVCLWQYFLTGVSYSSWTPSSLFAASRIWWVPFRHQRQWQRLVPQSWRSWTQTPVDRVHRAAQGRWNRFLILAWVLCTILPISFCLYS